jgi:ABC-type molybdate transport system permease subunit
LLTGATLAFARAIGEYGSVIFISSNMHRLGDRAAADRRQTGAVRLRRRGTVATLMLIASFICFSSSI